MSEYAKKTDIESFMTYKGTVRSFSDLPQNNLSKGDVYNILVAGGIDFNGTEVKAGDNVAYNGAGWDVLAGSIDLSKFVTLENGKGLSSNDFTDTYKDILDNLPDNLGSGIEGVSISGGNLAEVNENNIAILDLSNYVTIQSGKGLATNDYTTA